MTAALQEQSQTRGHLHHAFDTHPRELVVLSAEPIAPGVTHFVLADPAGRVLTSYEPGSHLIIQAGAQRNAYSLVGDGINPKTYGISVLRHQTGGGSEWLHANMEVGSRVLVEGPRSMFSPDLAAKKLLLVAAGIGVTPVLSHARAAARWGKPCEVVYIYRSGAAAHLEELRSLATEGAVELHEAQGREAGQELLQERLLHQPWGTHAYACGPAEMLDTYRTLALQSGWPKERVHLERFEAPRQEPGNPFTAKVASTGRTLTVDAGVSLLEVLLAAGHEVPNLCRQGVCGECRISVRAGKVEHRDHVLTEQEKSSGTVMLCCVSRGQEIEVEL